MNSMQELNKVKQLVFVYGTLREGEENYPLLADSKFLGKAVSARKFTMVDLGDYPAVIQQGDSAISGEVYVISIDTLAKLDILEEYPDCFQRITVSTPYGDTWMYVLGNMPESFVSQIEGGDWVARKAPNLAVSRD